MGIHLFKTQHIFSLFQMIPKIRLVSECCKGYTRSANGSSCIPVCSHPCYSGTCVGPDTCRCETGYGGRDCSKFCEPGTWGPDCSKTCPCKNGASCDPESGKCTCMPGWLGAVCDEKCPGGKYGQDCRDVCRYRNHVSGRVSLWLVWAGL